MEKLYYRIDCKGYTKECFDKIIDIIDFLPSSDFENIDKSNLNAIAIINKEFQKPMESLKELCQMSDLGIFYQITE